MFWTHFHPFFFLFFILIVGFFIANMILWRRRRGACFHNPYDAVTILENRLARGEISKEEYQEVKETLKG